MQRTLIWDIPTRLFHWMLALSFVGAWLTHESDQWLGVHVFLGYLMMGLVAFRVLWGLAGTHYARFSAFWFSPKEAWGYLGRVVTGQPDGMARVHASVAAAVLAVERGAAIVRVHDVAATKDALAVLAAMNGR